MFQRLNWVLHSLWLLCFVLGGLELNSFAVSEEVQLKSALIEFRQKLAIQLSWQETLFQEEVVPQYQRFIKNYHSAGAGKLAIEVDEEALRGYLAFYGPQYLARSEMTGKGADAKILVLLEADPGCESCQQSQDGVKNLVRLRLERRGLTAMFLSPTENKAVYQKFSKKWTSLKRNPKGGESGLAASDELVNALNDFVGEAKALGVIGLQLGNAAPEEDDTAHADEVRFELKSALQIRGLPLIRREKIILENDSIEQAEGRLFTDILTDLGMQLRSLTPAEAVAGEAGQKGSVSSSNELLVELSGFTSYPDYTKVRAILAGVLEPGTTLEDRSFAKDRIVFALVSKVSLDAIKKKVELLGLESAGNPRLRLQVKP